YCDLQKLQSNGVAFIYLKATQGRSYFDENYLSYRDQILGTNLAFGSEISYSNESTPMQQYRYFFKQVGQNTGSLPILIVAAVTTRSASDLGSLGQIGALLHAAGKRGMGEVE